MTAMLWIARARIKTSRWLNRAGFPKDSFLIPLAAVIGVLGGVVAMGFEFLVEASTHFFFGRFHGEAFDGPRLVLLVAIPAFGGLAVGAIQRWVARTPPGHGIPEVIESLARHHGQLKGRTGVFKAITSSLTIGSGGSAGVEGPIIQIGSVVGSVVARVLRVGHEHMHTLVGCGAASGLASIFNAPIAGVLFCLEVLLRDFSLKTFMPIVIASVLGVATAQALMGAVSHPGTSNQAIFAVPPDLLRYQFSIAQLMPYALLGVACGFMGIALIRSLVRSEQLWARVPAPLWLKPALGGAVLGLLGVGFAVIFDEVVRGYDPPPFFGNGYPVIEALFNPDSYAPDPQEGFTHPLIDPALGVLTAMLLLKLIGTALTLGSGGSGGVFAPSLFMGATLGAIVGVLVQKVGLFPDGTPATYALVGMAGVMSAAVHCPLTAFILVFEITRDYQVILPTMLVAILATLVSQLIQRDSIYALYLRQQGIRIGTLADMTLLRRLDVSTVPLTPAVLVGKTDPAQRLLDLAGDYAVHDFAVVDEADRYVGMVVGDDVRTTLLQREAVPLLIVAELMRTDLPTVTRDETLEMVLDKFSRHDVSSLAVVDANGVVKGLITRSRLMARYQNALEDA